MERGGVYIDMSAKERADEKDRRKKKEEAGGWEMQRKI